ncbi:N-lysine methyltransferase KMT5A-like isoform X2 [Strongylocentrotus purpuratus]|uniref:Uncharacterized protein n=1 Tax=Strongylocentrotus purpuratus TaxID=7668 RepID=A0A7M7NC54_STRPU|nr:N-lysine methyltransferase KMT5A-like isoform X2 [Strongylocentrotus purpuratus]
MYSSRGGQMLALGLKKASKQSNSLAADGQTNNVHVHVDDAELPGLQMLPELKKNIYMSTQSKAHTAVEQTNSDDEESLVSDSEVESFARMLDERARQLEASKIAERPEKMTEAQIGRQTRMSRRLREPADTNRPEDYTEKDRKGFCVKILPGKGRAVFTTKNFHSGEFLLHYHGELIDKAEAEERERFEETGFRYFFKYRGKNLCST